MEFQDKELVCPCGNTFIWMKGEQEFLNDLYNKGKIDSLNEPKRCIPCRKKKKEYFLKKKSENSQVNY